MATRTIRVCDICESTENVETIEIKTTDRKARLDLCGEHAAPVTHLLVTASTPVATPADDERAAKRKAARERRAAAKAAETETTAA